MSIDFGRVARETWAKIKEYEYKTPWDPRDLGPETKQTEIIAAALEDTAKLAIHLEKRRATTT